MMKSRLLEKGHAKLQNAVSDLEDRHKDIIKLEKVKYIILFIIECKSST
jgi:hypothetical protein